MKVAILGAAGLLGSEIVPNLVRHGVDVVAIDRDRSVLQLPGTNGQLADVRGLCKQDLIGVHTIVQLAAEKSIPASFSNKGQGLRNARLDEHVFRLAIDSGVTRVIYASSCEVYGDSQTSNAESGRLAPRSPYAVGKAASEMMAGVLAQLGETTFCGLRLHNTYGWQLGGEGFITKLIHAGITGSPIIVEGDGQQRRDFTYIRDMGAMLAEVVLARELPDVMNVGSGCEASIAEIVNRYRELIGPIDVVASRPRRNEIHAFRSDFSLMRAIITSRSSVELPAGLVLTHDAAKKALR